MKKKTIETVVFDTTSVDVTQEERKQRVDKSNRGIVFGLSSKTIGKSYASPLLKINEQL